MSVLFYVIAVKSGDAFRVFFYELVLDLAVNEYVVRCDTSLAGIDGFAPGTAHRSELDIRFFGDDTGTLSS